MVKNADLFKVSYEDGEDGDLYAVSIVDDPANGFTFIPMSKESVKLRSDEKKKILYGIVLRPEQKIYREFEDGTPYYLTFDSQTIERLSQDFLKKGYQKNSTYNHDNNKWLEDVTVVENWIVEDPAMDKLAAIGFSDLRKGDWAIGMKVSDEVWSEYIETGKAKGFSIDSFLQFEKIQMKNVSKDDNANQINKTMKKESLFRKFLNLISEVKMETYVSDLGPVTADALEAGMVVYAESGDPLVSAEFIVDNMSYKTDEMGVISEVTEVMPVEDMPAEELPAEEAPAEEAPAEETPVEELPAEAQENALEIAEELANPVEEIDVEELKAKIAELQMEIEKLTQAQESVLMENTQLKAMDASKKIPAEPAKDKASINFKRTEKNEDSALDAISRITKKINK